MAETQLLTQDVVLVPEQPGAKPAVTRHSMTERMVLEARRSFANVPETELDGIVGNVVGRIWGEGLKVTTFVPVFAAQQIKHEIDARDREDSAPAGIGTSVS